jgi:DnaJ family protein C protein 2
VTFEDVDDEGKQWKGRGRKKRKLKKREGKDLYKLLGLGNLRYLASEKEIRRGYQKAALKHHPDKAAQAGSEAEKAEIEERFKAIQAAYETLSDKGKRREYDSLDEFDDSLPSTCPEGGFFETFGPAFRRQARWSDRDPTPGLGEDGTPHAEVEKFYEFWFRFKSWREFPHEEEEDPEQAEGREHRRWIERFNAKLRDKGKKEEARRLRDFVDAAYRLDPRIRRKKEEEEAKRQAKKQAKRQARQAEADEKARVEREAREAREAEEEQARAAQAEAKKQRDHDRKAAQRQRSRLRKLAGAVRESGGEAAAEAASTDSVEFLTAKLAATELSALGDALEGCTGDAAAGAAALRAAADAVKEKERGAREEAQAEREEAERLRRDEEERARAQARAASTPWENPELKLLEKGLKKYPKGYAKRWNLIAAFVGTRTPDECAEKSKDVLAKQAAAGVGHVVRKKHLANMEIKSPVTLRHESFSDVDVELSGTAANVYDAQMSSGASQTEGAKKAPSRLGAPEAAAPAPTAAPWTKEEGVKLIQALKAAPKDAPDRWDRVAAALPGRSKKDCMLRYKALMAKLKASKK